MKLQILLALCFAAAQVSSKDLRVISGNEAKPGQFPFLVGITTTRNGPAGPVKEFCSGTLITELWIMTAAHCTHEATELVLTFGPNRTDPILRVNAYVLIQYPYFQPYTRESDFALIQLDEPVKLSEFIQLVRLPTPEEENDLHIGETVRGIGWGPVSENSGPSDTLHYADLKVISNSECGATYGSGLGLTMTCTSGATPNKPCREDGGGPLVFYKDNVPTQIGIMAYNHKTGCGGNYPTAYTHVGSFMYIVEGAIEGRKQGVQFEKVILPAVKHADN